MSYVASDQLYIKAGTEHSSIVRWNQLYHHGRWLEPTAARPIMAQFEGGSGILPLHRTGVTLGGSLHTDGARYEYFGTISNGRGTMPNNKQRTSDADASKAIDLGLAVEPACAPGLRIGAAFVSDRIPVDPTSASALRMRSINETIATGHIEYRTGRTTVTAEYAQIQHDVNADGSNFDSETGYLQIMHACDSWSPYTRYDYRRMAAGDPFYNPAMRDGDRWLQYLGVRWDAHANVSVKFEVGAGKADLGGISDQDVFEGQVQLSWWL